MNIFKLQFEDTSQYDYESFISLQEAWDNNLVVTGVNELGENIYETTEVKIARLGERPINYIS